MDAALTQTLAITQAPRRSLRKRARVALDVVTQAVAASARGEAYDRVLGTPDTEAALGSLPRSEKERLLACGLGKPHA